MSEKLTMTFPYYENPGMLKYQLDIWNNYPEGWRDKFEVIVVDDGSPKDPAIQCVSHTLFNFRLYRMTVDVPWNQTSARNLSAYQADKHSWLFLTDIDHVLDYDNFVKLLKIVQSGELNRKWAYTFARLNGPEKTPYHYHPNSFLMHRSLYLEVGGYDEEFAGQVYATDGMFRKTLKGVAKNIYHLKNVSIIRFGREHIPDASTRTLKRGKEFQAEEVMLRVKERDKIKRTRGEKPRVLSFPWVRQL